MTAAHALPPSIHPHVDGITERSRESTRFDSMRANGVQARVAAGQIVPPEVPSRLARSLLAQDLRFTWEDYIDQY